MISCYLILTPWITTFLSSNCKLFIKKGPFKTGPPLVLESFMSLIILKDFYKTSPILHGGIKFNLSAVPDKRSSICEASEVTILFVSQA